MQLKTKSVSQLILSLILIPINIPAPDCHQYIRLHIIEITSLFLSPQQSKAPQARGKTWCYLPSSVLKPVQALYRLSQSLLIHVFII